jgi:CelD/BcsL family acetyltransferase involved in cellulose biosynthesis
MRIVVKHPAELAAPEIGAWRELLTGDALSSPYFTPEFNRIAAETYPGVKVALALDGGRLAGIFPFRTGPLGFSRAPAGAMCDFQGLIAAPDARLDMAQIARDAGARVFVYGALPADQARHGFPGETTSACAVVGLEDGYEGWRADRDAQTGTIKKLDARRRALQRDIGPIRVEIDDASDAAFEILCSWKRAQYRASGYFDIFAAPATRILLDRIRTRRERAFRGVLSCLYAGDRLIAAHFGMQAGPVLHYWFPAYDPALGKYSPGNLLLDELAGAGAAQGWSAIHLGDGDHGYKKEFGSRRIPLIRGALRTRSTAAAAHQAGEWLTRTAEAAPLGPLSRWPGKAMRKIGRIADFGWKAA